MDNSPSSFWPTAPALPAVYCPQPPVIAEQRAAILAVLEPETITAPSEWPSLRRVRGVRQLGTSPEELLARLQKSFPDSELIATGVAYRIRDELKLSNVFGVAPASFRIRYRQQRPIDAVSCRGLLSGAKREWARLAGERRGISEPHQFHIVTESDRDARAFEQLRLSVTAAWPLRSETLDILSNCLRLRVPYAPYKCVFAVPLWNLGEFNNSVSTSVRERLLHVERIARFYQLACGALVRFWYPNGNELHRFRDASKLSDRKMLAAELSKSLANSCYSPAEALIVLRDNQEVDFPTALRRLEGAITESADFPRVAEATACLNTLTRSFRRNVLSKFPAASRAADGGESLASCMAAQLAKEWYERLDQVVAARSINAGNNPRRIDREQLSKKRREVIDAFCKLYRYLPKPR